ncbi:E3 ubiquitin-protein ligase TRIM39 isoform X1 [Microcaecilia unicolor]|uniref:E3 ubiquitin-protein ligase TRIM39-like isoform X1 n=1 Tax=Microcaecilia unicolor TaxID=1415580 RepID=A0A6P7XLM8_9AMPH|nr:E3 ubiquitin-protein ligase TRIM39-like isoform X1 [Microcaecilia unicolor]
MAGENSPLELQDETTCSICLDYFTDPVLTDCGHNFCYSCIARCWEGIRTNFPCPQCRVLSEQRNLRPNRQLANVTEIAKNLSPCSGRRHKGSLCEAHKESLKLFCEDDQTLICLVCGKSRDHRSHTLTPVEEAVQEYKERFENYLELLRKEVEEIWIFKSSEKRKVKQLKYETEIKRKKIVADFGKLHQFLNKEKQSLLSKLEEEEKKILQRIRENVTRLEEQSYSLLQLISEIEEKCQQSDTELLKDIKNTLNRYEKVEIAELDAVSTEGRISFHLSYPQQYLILTKMVRKFRDTLSAEFDLVNVTLDPQTAHPNLILSEDRKSVTLGDTRHYQPDNHERFDTCPCILASEIFTSGRHYWEVEVGDKTAWDLGICKASVSRKGQITYTPKKGYWAVVLRNGNEYLACTSPYSTELLLNLKPQAVGIFLDYEAGKISFYNVQEESHLFTFTDSFTGKLQPFFSPCLKEEGRNAGALRIQVVSN